VFSSFQVTRTFEAVEPLPNRRSGHFQLFRQIIDRQTLSTTQQIQNQLIDWPDGRMDCGIGNIHGSDPLHGLGLLGLGASRSSARENSGGSIWVRPFLTSVIAKNGFSNVLAGCDWGLSGVSHSIHAIL
jgi:hypothetical protein